MHTYTYMHTNMYTVLYATLGGLKQASGFEEGADLHARGLEQRQNCYPEFGASPGVCVCVYGLHH